MRFRNKGRKIYKTKEKNYYGKSPAGKAFSVGLTVLLIGGIGFLGYSIAEPIINYNKKTGDQADASLTAAVEPAQSPTVNDYSGEMINIEQNSNIEQYKAAAFTANDLANAATLAAALNRVPAEQGIEYIEIPLKVSGGLIYYASDNYYAQVTGAVQSQLTLDEITGTVRQKGYKPAAMISTFNDNIMPASFPETGYITIDDGSQWIDNDLAAGGKPWMSPFQDAAVSYVTQIVDEVSSADFDKVICSDFVFPVFRDSDVEYLGATVVSPDRYWTLIQTANQMYDTILRNGSTMMLEVNAADILKGSDDILQQMLLDVNTVILNINVDEIGSGVYTSDTVYEFTGTAAEKVDKMLGLVSGKLKGFNVAVRISGTGVNTEELLKAKEKISGYGYSSFVIG